MITLAAFLTVFVLTRPILSRDVGDVVVPPLPLFLLKLDRDAAHSAPLQPLHQVGDKPGNLIVISALAFHPGISSLRTRGFSSLLRRGLEGMRATSSMILLLVWKSRVS